MSQIPAAVQSSKAATQIFSAIQRRKSSAYITHRWSLIAWLLQILPNWAYNRI